MKFLTTPQGDRVMDDEKSFGTVEAGSLIYKLPAFSTCLIVNLNGKLEVITMAGERIGLGSDDRVEPTSALLSEEK